VLYYYPAYCILCTDCCFTQPQASNAVYCNNVFHRPAVGCVGKLALYGRARCRARLPALTAVVIMTAGVLIVHSYYVECAVYSPNLNACLNG
jgi:hypothetical protein